MKHVEVGVRNSAVKTYPKLVLHQNRRVLVQLLEKRGGLFWRGVFDGTLQHSTAIGMRRQVTNVAAECVEKDVALGWDEFQNLLNDLYKELEPWIEEARTYMVAVCILDTLQDVSVELVYNGRLLLGRAAVQSLLDDTTAVHVE